MTPTGSVSGRVQDGERKALVGVPVQLLHYTYNVSGQKIFRPLAMGLTNDRGEYRLFMVNPGRYYVSAGTSQGPSGANDGPTAPARNVVQESFEHAFYPGVGDPQQATIIEVKPGADLRGIDFTLGRQLPVRVRGRVIDSTTGQPPSRVQLRMNYRDPGTGVDYDLEYMGREGAVYQNGSFEFRSVLPGLFSVSATVEDPKPPAPRDPSPTFRETPAVYGTQRTGYVPINVGASDVEGILITVPAAGSIAGRLNVENGGPTPTAVVELTPSSNGGPPPIPGLPQPSFSGLAPDGTFRMTDLTPGEYMPAVWRLPGLYTKEVRFGGANILNRPLQFTGAETGTLEIVLSSRVATVEGKIIGERLEPLPGAQVVLVPDRNRERSHLFKAVTTDQSGRFRMTDIAPGDYKLYAWEALERYAYFDPVLLRQAEPNARAIHIEELSRQTVDLKAMPPP